MKRNQLWALALCVGIILSPLGASLLTGCKTAGVYDPVKTEKVEAIVTPFVTTSVQMVFANNPQIKTDLGDYFRAFGGVFKSMVDTSQFSPTYLVTAADSATQKWQGKLPANALMAKNGVIALYRVLYSGSADAPLDPSKAPLHVATVIAAGIDQALKDAGLPGL